MQQALAPELVTKVPEIMAPNRQPISAQLIAQPCCDASVR